MSEENKTPRTIRKTLDRKFGVSESREERRPRREERSGDDGNLAVALVATAPVDFVKTEAGAKAALASVALTVNVDPLIATAVPVVLTTSPSDVLNALAVLTVATKGIVLSAGSTRLASPSTVSVRNRRPKSMPTKPWTNLYWKPAWPLPKLPRLLAPIRLGSRSSWPSPQKRVANAKAASWEKVFMW